MRTMSVIFYCDLLQPCLPAQKFWLLYRGLFVNLPRHIQLFCMTVGIESKPSYNLTALVGHML